jgi:type VI secretion system secreted protein Hcp
VALVFAALTLNGAPLGGDVRHSAVAGIDVSRGHIEVFELSFGSRIAGATTGLRGASRRELSPVRLTKPLDAATPPLYRALAQNSTLGGEVRIFDTNPEDGTTRHRFTVTIAGGRVTSVETRVPDVVAGLPVPGRPYDTVELVPHTIVYTDVVGGVTHEDVWSDVR